MALFQKEYPNQDQGKEYYIKENQALIYKIN